MEEKGKVKKQKEREQESKGNEKKEQGRERAKEGNEMRRKDGRGKETKE